MQARVKISRKGATTADARSQLVTCLRNAGLPTAAAHSGKSLGDEFQSRADQRFDRLRDQRADKAAPTMNKLGVMPWSHTTKASILVRDIFLAVLYGCEFHDTGAHFLQGKIFAKRNSLESETIHVPVHVTLVVNACEVCAMDLGLTPMFPIYVRLLSPDGDRAIQHGPKKHPVGPTCVNARYLRRLGWTLQKNFKCVTQHGDVFNLDQITTLQFKHQVASSPASCLVPKLRLKIGMDALFKVPQ